MLAVNALVLEFRIASEMLGEVENLLIGSRNSETPVWTGLQDIAVVQALLHDVSCEMQGRQGILEHICHTWFPAADILGGLRTMVTGIDILEDVILPGKRDVVHPIVMDGHGNDLTVAPQLLKAIEDLVAYLGRHELIIGTGEPVMLYILILKVASVMDDAILLRILAIDINTMDMGLEAGGMIQLDRLLQEYHDSLATQMRS